MTTAYSERSEMDAATGELDLEDRHALRRVAGLSSAVLDRLQQHEWPGNARELRNLMERAVILAQEGGLVELEQLPPGFGKAPAPAAVATDGNSINLRVGTTVAPVFAAITAAPSYTFINEPVTVSRPSGNITTG